MKRYLFVICLLVMGIFIFACSSQQKDEMEAMEENPQTNIELSQLAADVDPACGMKLMEGHIHATVEHNGKTYGVCSAACLEKFKMDPDQYVAKLEKKSEEDNSEHNMN